MVEARLLPDTCTVGRTSTDTLGDSGAWGEPVVSLVSYNGSTDIPCRLEEVPYYRYADIEEQELLINQFRIYYPYDLVLKLNDRITHKNSVYEVRKLNDKMSWEWVGHAIILELEDIDGSI